VAPEWQTERGGKPTHDARDDKGPRQPRPTPEFDLIDMEVDLMDTLPTEERFMARKVFPSQWPGQQGWRKGCHSLLLSPTPTNTFHLKEAALFDGIAFPPDVDFAPQPDLRAEGGVLEVGRPHLSPTPPLSTKSPCYVTFPAKSDPALRLM